MIQDDGFLEEELLLLLLLLMLRNAGYEEHKELLGVTRFDPANKLCNDYVFLSSFFGYK